MSLRVRRLGGASLWAAALLAGSPVAVADPAAGQPAACDAATPQEARAQADRLFDAGQYQHAGECYQAAGDLTHANLAFVKAAGPKGQETAAGLKAQGDTAKALFAGVARTFRSNRNP